MVAKTRSPRKCLSVMQRRGPRERPAALLPQEALPRLHVAGRVLRTRFNATEAPRSRPGRPETRPRQRASFAPRVPAGARGCYKRLMDRKPFSQWDRFLCHYTSRCAALAHILPQQTLRFSSFGQMRDPLEQKEVYIGVEGDAASEAWRALNRTVNTQVNQVLKREYKLLSLTQDNVPPNGIIFEDGENEAMFGRCYGRPRIRSSTWTGLRALPRSSPSLASVIGAVQR